MKKALIITSIIEVDNSFPLTYSKVRSTFSNEERFRHTVFTLNSLDRVADEETTIFLLDGSENYQNYQSILRYQPNLFFIPVKEHFPEIFTLSRTHPNKSHCETMMMLSFFKKFKDDLAQFDYLVKISGRYFIDKSFTMSEFNESNLDKIFFKKPLKFEWQNHWPYEMVDRRKEQGDNYLYQYCSVLYGWGRQQNKNILDVLRTISAFTDHPNGRSYDLETLLYFFTREYQKNIIETDWLVSGWEGVSGSFMRY